MAWQAEIDALRREIQELKARVSAPATAPFRVVDGQGAVIAEIGTPDGIPEMRLLGPDGAGISLFSGPGATGITLDRSGGEKGISLALIPETGVALIHLAGSQGRSAASLAAHPEGTGALDLYGPGGEPKLLLRVLDDGGAVVISHSTGEPVVSINACGGGGEVNIRNRDGRPLVSIHTLGATTEGEIRIYNRSGYQVARLAPDQDANGSLVIGDRNGNTTFAAPASAGEQPE